MEVGVQGFGSEAGFWQVEVAGSRSAEEIWGGGVRGQVGMKSDGPGHWGKGCWKGR